ncbi:ParA family protein [Robertmurraya sp.]|uniref:ParA family protein n=1 Tax=Robertmurraya sp. TaxID=2837525 RepID=UPI003703DC67
MGKVITFGVQKGGSGKTTSAGVCAWLLSQEHKVLAVDLDSQGNLTELLTQQDIYDFTGRTILEALKEQLAEKYIHRITDNLHIITAEDLLATFSRWVYREYEKQHPTRNPSLILKETLDSIKNDYDFIIIDTPPALGDQTINALAASDAVIALFESSKFCYSALERFIETIVHIQDKLNPDLKIAGILRVMIDNRRVDNKALIDLVEQEYEGLAFETIIHRKAATGRLSINGFLENTELKQAVEPYHDFLKELIDRV